MYTSTQTLYYIYYYVMLCVVNNLNNDKNKSINSSTQFNISMIINP